MLSSQKGVAINTQKITKEKVRSQKVTEASTLIFKIRSCTVRSDLKTKHKISRKCLIFKIRSYNARSDLRNKSARFSGKSHMQQKLLRLMLMLSFERGEKTPTPKISALVRKRPVLLRANFVLTKDRKRPYYGHFCGKIHREGSCSKATGGP